MSASWIEWVTGLVCVSEGVRERRSGLMQSVESIVEGGLDLEFLPSHPRSISPSMGVWHASLNENQPHAAFQNAA